MTETATPPRRVPWPADRWPTPMELLEYARVTQTSEVTAILDRLLQLADLGQRCHLQAHHSQLRHVTGRVERLLAAHASARRRAAHWRAIAVELATATEDRRLAIAAGILLLDGRPPQPHTHLFVPTPAGRAGGQLVLRNRCSAPTCGAWEHPDALAGLDPLTPDVVDDHADATTEKDPS